MSAPAEDSAAQPQDDSVFRLSSMRTSGWMRPLLYFLGQHPFLSALALVVTLIGALLDTIGVGMVLPLLSSLLGVSESQGGRVAAALNQLVAVLPIDDRVLAACALLFAVTVLKFMLMVVAEYLASRVGGLLLHDTKIQLLDKYYRLPLSFFLDHRHADLKHVVFSSTQRVASCFWLLFLAVADLLQIAAVVALLVVVSFEMALAVLLGAAVFYAIVGRVSRTLSYRWGNLSAASQIEQIGVLDELLAGLKHIVVLGVLPHWLDRFRRASLAHVRYQSRQRLVAALPRGVLEIALVAILAGAVVILRLTRPQDFLDAVPVLGLVGFAFVKLLPSLNNVSRTRLDVMHYMPEVELLYRVMTYSTVVPAAGGRTFAALERDIVFDEVTFSYPGRGLTLDRFSLTIGKRQTVAIVGRSGIGKTTIVNLLLGLYAPQQGAIRIDGIDIRKYDIETWRRRIGVVTQDVFIFHGTVAENIAFGDRSYTRAQIEDAARLANADEFVRALPAGYDTLVGEHGMKLSGGQQQRLAIARVLLRRPEILVFDEATSALDVLSERLVQEAIARATRDHTVILVTHRLSTVQRADTIVVLDAGRAVEQGSHDQLIQARGVYERLVQGL